MKKVRIKKISILTMISGVLLFWSCQKDDIKIVSQTKLDNNEPDKVGQ